MRTNPITPEFLQGSIVAVPPLARDYAFALDKAANRALIAYLEQAGIRSLMYGGNANFYNLPVSEYADTLDFLEEAVHPETWVLPSVGPDFGKMVDHARILKQRRFPAAMLLPSSGPHTEDGLTAAVRKFTDLAGIPAVIYIKTDGYLSVEEVGKLADEGRIASIKYAIVRDDPANDPYLKDLVDRIGAGLVVSGIGERPAVVHFEKFGLRSMTSGSCCVGPRGSMKMLRLMLHGRYAEAEELRQHYLPLEDCRDSISPIRVLHDAVTLAGIARMGPMMPLLSNLRTDDIKIVGAIARQLWERDRFIEQR